MSLKSLLRAVGLVAGFMPMAWMMTTANADIIGNPVIDRPTIDTASGSIFILSSDTAAGEVTDWSFFNNNAAQNGLSITPLILQSSGSGYEITGIGTTRTSNGSGVQNFAFDVVSGSNEFGPGSIFGWQDGNVTGGNTGVIEWTNSTPQRVSWFGTQTNYSVGQSFGGGTGLLRTYSLQANVAENRASTGAVLMDRTLNDGANGGIFINGEAFSGDGTVSEWGFHSQASGLAGREVTPLLMKQNGANWEIVGIGATRTTDGNGAHMFDFDLVAGSDQIDTDTFFAWKDGSQQPRRN